MRLSRFRPVTISHNLFGHIEVGLEFLTEFFQFSQRSGKALFRAVADTSARSTRLKKAKPSVMTKTISMYLAGIKGDVR